MTTTGGGGCRTCRRDDNCEAADAGHAAVTTTGGGRRPTCRSLPTCCPAANPRRRMPCPASVKTTGGPRSLNSASSKTTGGRRRPTCRLAVDARRRTTYLFCRRYKAAVPLLAASPHGCEAADALPCRRRLLEAAGALFALTIIEGRSRDTCGIAALRTQTSNLLPRLGCEAAVDIPVPSPLRSRSRPTCCLAAWMRGG